MRRRQLAEPGVLSQQRLLDDVVRGQQLMGEDVLAQDLV